MSELIVVRHGQASFLSDDYDRLSDLGKTQSKALGSYWAAHDLLPTRLVVGPRVRQRETAEALVNAMESAGKTVPDPIFDDRLDEFDWDGIMAYANSTLTKADPNLAALKDAFDEAPDVTAKRRTIQHYMEAVMARWASGSFHEDGLETWQEFGSRVEVAMRVHTADSPRGSRVVLVTSGGVGAVTVGRVLGLLPEKTVGLIWTLRNAALVEYLYHGDHVSLSGFNKAPHLPSPEMWTYR